MRACFFKEGLVLIRAAHVPCFPLCEFTSLQFTAAGKSPGKVGDQVLIRANLCCSRGKFRSFDHCVTVADIGTLGVNNNNNNNIQVLCCVSDLVSSKKKTQNEVG